MNVWHDIRHTALHGAFNEIAPAVVAQYHKAWPKRRGLTGLIPVNEQGHPLIKEEAFIAGMEANLAHSPRGDRLPTLPAKEREEALTAARKEAAELYKTVRENNAVAPKAGGYSSSPIPLPGLRDYGDPHTSRLEVISARVSRPLTLDRGDFAANARDNPRDAFRTLVNFVTVLGHEIGHGVSRLNESPTHFERDGMLRNIEEVRSNIFGIYVAGLIFGPAMVWQMKRHMLYPGDGYPYYAPSVYRAAARDMATMFQRPEDAADHPHQMGLCKLYDRASRFAERQHRPTETRWQEAPALHQLADFEKAHKTDSASRMERLESVAAGTAPQKVYGKYYPAAYRQERLYGAEDLMAAYTTRMCAANPLKCS